MKVQLLSNIKIILILNFETTTIKYAKENAFMRKFHTRDSNFMGQSILEKLRATKLIKNFMKAVDSLPCSQNLAA